MSDVIAALRTILLADGNVAAIARGVHSDSLPQGMPTPAVVLWSISSVPENAIEKDIGYESATVQVESYANSRDVSNALGAAVRKALANYRGVVSGVRIKGIGLGSGLQHRTDRPQLGTDQWRFVTHQDFEVPHNVYEVT